MDAKKWWLLTSPLKHTEQSLFLAYTEDSTGVVCTHLLLVIFHNFGGALKQKLKRLQGSLFVGTFFVSHKLSTGSQC